VLVSLAAHKFGALVELRAKEPGRREARWAHLLGAPSSDAPGDEATGAVAAAAAGPGGNEAARSAGRHRAFHDAVLAQDWDTAVAQLADDVVFRSPAVHAPYEGRDATAMVLRAVSTVFEDFTYVDVLDAGDRAGLVFHARVGERQLEGWDYLRFDDDGRIREFTVMIRPLSGLTALVEAMRAALARAGVEV